MKGGRKKFRAILDILSITVSAKTQSLKQNLFKLQGKLIKIF